MEFRKKKSKNRFSQFQPDEPISGRKSNWLDEEAEWRDLKEQVKRRAAEDVNRNRQSGRSATKPLHSDREPEKVEVNIKLSVPKIDTQKLKKRFKHVSSAFQSAKSLPLKLKETTVRQRTLLAIALCIVITGTAALKLNIKSDSSAEVSKASNGAGQAGVPVATHDPEFDTVLPQSRDIKKEQIFYDPVRKFAKYDDEVDTVKVTISQQPLPEAFKSDPAGKVKSLAEGFSATEKLSVGQQDMYYGRSEKGPQTLILSKNNVLIFIATTQPVEKEALKLYASDLN
jgi:hypothetical protein